MVEQARYFGGWGANAEIAWGFDQRIAHHVHPHPVGDHTSSQRILGMSDGMGQFKAAAARLKWLPLFRTKNGQELPRNFGAAACGDYRAQTRLVRLVAVCPPEPWHVGGLLLPWP